MGINVIENIAAAAAIRPFKKLDVAKNKHYTGPSFRIRYVLWFNKTVVG